MKLIIETARLCLREFMLDDAAFIVQLLNTPGWLEFIGDRNIHTEEQATTYLQNGPIASYEKNGFGLWMVQLKKEGEPIGMCGIINRDTLDHPDIGFALLPEFAGKGYAFEMASGTLQYAADVLKLSVILGITVPNNKNSIRLLEKIGMAFSRAIVFPSTNEELALYTTPTQA